MTVVQVVPRPAGAQRGDPAPWEQLAPEARSSIPLSEVRLALQAGRGARGPWRPASRVAPAELPPRGDDRAAAVLCLLFERQGQARVVLTRRSRSLRHHAGEVCFPGGRLDQDEEPLGAALREAREEVGLLPATVEVIGELGPLTTRSSTALVHCFVGCAVGGDEGAAGPALDVCSEEVERVFDVALADLAAPGVFHEELWPLAGPGGVALRAVPFFDLPAPAGELVWGATGRMLVELLDVVLCRRAQG